MPRGDDEEQQEEELDPVLLPTQRLDPGDDFQSLSRLDQLVLSRFMGDRPFTTTMLQNQIGEEGEDHIVQCQAFSSIGVPLAPEVIKLASWDDTLEEVAMLI